MAHTKIFRRDVDCLGEIFELVDAFVSQEELGEKLELTLSFVAEELFTNMVKYNTGSDRGISISLSRSGDGVELELIDFDVDPFDPADIPRADVDRPLEERQPGGLGIHLVEAMVNEISYQYNDRQMKVTVTKNLES